MPFDLYFAGSENKEADDYIAHINANRLYSQLNDRKSIDNWNKRLPINSKLFIDSGAHSAHTKGMDIDVDDYITYVNQQDDNVFIFAQLDKIPGIYRKPKTREQWLEAPRRSWENYMYMRERVVSPHKLIPVFHQGEEYIWLNNMVEWVDSEGQYIPYIGLSPRGDVPISSKVIFLQKCFNIIKNSHNPYVKVHAFGMTSLGVLEQFPFTSADSTTWLLVGAMGQIMTPRGLVYVSDKNSSRQDNIVNMGADARSWLNEYLDSIDMTYEQVSQDYSKRMIANVKYMWDWALNYTYKPIRIRHKQLWV